MRDSGPFHFGVFLVYIALLMVAVMNLLIGMFVQHEVALDALCGVTSVTMQGFMGIVSDTDSEVSMWPPLVPMAVLAVMEVSLKMHVSTWQSFLGPGFTTRFTTL